MAHGTKTYQQILAEGANNTLDRPNLEAQLTHYLQSVPNTAEFGFTGSEDIRNFAKQIADRVQPVVTSTGETDAGAGAGAGATIFTPREIHELFKAGDLDPNGALSELTQYYQSRGLTQAESKTASENQLKAFRAISGQGGESGPTTPPVPTPTVLPDLDAREDAFRLLEGTTVQDAEGVFDRFLSRQPLGSLSAIGERALQSQFSPAYTSFQATSEDPFELFRDFLGGGGKILGPDALKQRLLDIGGFFDTPQDQRTSGQDFLINRFKPNETAFNAFMQPLLSRVNPQFRNDVFSAGRDIFNRFQDTTPELPFMRELARRGGDLFEAFR